MKTILLSLLLIIWQPCLTWSFTLDAIANVKNAPTSELRIFGGVEAAPHSKPYQVYLFMYKQRSTSKCGGSLISQNYVLTAAHCVREKNQNKIEYIDLLFGAHNIEIEEPEQVKQRVNMENVIMHPKKTDAALIRTQNEVKLTEAIQPIKLPPLADENKEYDGTDATASGWGKTFNEDRNKLREFTLKVIPMRYCIFKIPNTLCLKASSKHSICPGDSGGPLVIEDQDGAPLQIGISTLSFGKTNHSCTEGYASGYTRVNKIIHWIKTESDALIQ